MSAPTPPGHRTAALLPDPEAVPGAIRIDTVIAPRDPWSAHLAAGEHLRLIDLEGRQAVDFLCFSAAETSERYHMPNTIKIPMNVYISAGSVLYSDRARPMMTVVEDTMGRHDTLYGCCSFDVDRVRYGRTNARSCQQNFETEMARHGIGREHVVPNVNFFMSVPVAPDGTARIVESPSRPGEMVDLRAEMDVIVVLSNCPEELNPAAGDRPSPIRAIVWGG